MYFHRTFFPFRYEQRHGSALASSPREIRSKRTPSGHLPQVVAQRAIQSIQESIYVIELFISQMYVCMPFPTGKFSGTDKDVDSAALISLDRTKIRAVLAESIITSGSFDLFRLCFTEDRGPHYDYTGRPDGGFTNCCFVPKGANNFAVIILQSKFTTQVILYIEVNQYSSGRSTYEYQSALFLRVFFHTS